MSLTGRILLKVGGAFSLAIALLHLVIIFVGAPAYRYFGAGEDMARLAESGSLIPAILTLLITFVFAAFGLYAFAGSGVIRQLPLQRPILVMIGAIYTLRGAFVAPEAIQFLQATGNVPPQEVVFSFGSLLIGCLYLLGALRPGK